VKDFVRLARNQWDRTSAWVLIGLGSLALLAGWFGVSATAFPGEQMPYVVSGGLVGIFLLGLGATMWLSADLRDEWRELERLEQVLGTIAGSPNGAGDR
jgi:hypothetical protein